MNARRTLATTGRVLNQLRHDHRSMALIVVVPCLLLGLIAWMFADTPMVINRFGPMLLAIFPAILMFLVTSVGTLRERTSGTLERLMTTPLAKADFLVGYAVAFTVAATIQATVVTAWAVWVCGMDVKGSIGALVFVAVVDAVLGSCLGLAASSLARTEFQAVQMMPAFLLPQLVVCGLVMPRDQMPRLLEWVSGLAPFTYAIEATNAIAAGQPLGDSVGDILAVAGFVALALVMGVLTLRRRTP
jgi:ABC-2 type transport system permease protein